MTSDSRFFHRSALICVVLMFGFIDAAHANFLDDIGDFFSGNAPEVATHSQCYSYATVAVIRSGDVQKNNCPLSGPRYGSDYNAHYFWCKGVTPETARAEGQARNDEVNACERHLSFCNVYSDYAANGAYENKLYGCGFTGPRWGEGREGHRSYCLSVRIAQEKDGYTGWPQSEMTARLDSIAKCKSQHSKGQIQYCTSYANKAVASAKTFKEKNCDPSQNTWGRWDTDYDDHFTWCIGQGRFLSVTASSGNPEATAREAAVSACLARGGGPAGITPVVNRNSGAFGTPGKAVAPPTGVQTRVAPVAPPRRPSMPRAPSIGSGGPSLAVSPNNSAMERLNPTGLSGNQRYTAPTTRAAPKTPCDTCGSNRVMPSNDNVRPSPVVTPRPTAPSAPAPSTVPDRNFNYGGMSEPGKEKVRLPK